jgi:signal transduction histidine kinase
MKLFSRYNHILILISFVGLIIIGFLFYQTLTSYLNRQIDKDLVEEIIEVKEFSKKNLFYEPHEFENLNVIYKKIARINGDSIYGDTLYYNPTKQVTESSRFLKTQMMVLKQPYEVFVVASKFEREEQIKSICLIILIPVLLLLGVVLLVNRLLLRKAWIPFDQMLKNINNFNVNRAQPYDSVEAPIKEFAELNKVLLDLSLKIKSDYNEIKLFTENASHEMMTPLAVINSKLDTMLQSNILGKEDGEALADLYKATSRLTKLNQSLLLLVKIDNDLLQDTEQINVKEVIEEKISHFQELLNGQNLSLVTNLTNVDLIGSRQLIEILINNLFSNVIRHNYENGSIAIILNKERLIFKNTGHGAALNPDKVFERFFKDKSSEGTGLGLAILKQICNRQNYVLVYSYHDYEHIFEIIFNTKS